jgi:hypothetical protein
VANVTTTPAPPNTMGLLDSADVWSKCIAQRYFSKADMVLQVGVVLKTDLTL